MKRLFAIITVLSGVLLLLQNCKRDPPVIAVNSAYTGTPYSLKSLPIFSFGPMQVPYADSLTVEGIALGRRLFYDTHLSLDGKKSCSSCHHVQYALSDSGNALSVNEFGYTVRNAPVLQNLAWAQYFFWDGRAPTLSAQAQNAFQHELGLNVVNAISYLQTDTTDVRLFKKAFGYPGTITENKTYLAIEQFVLSAVSYNSRFDSVMRGDPGETFTASESNAFYNLFFTEQGDCFHCHIAGQSLLMTNEIFENNGLDSAATINDFKDPGRGAITGNAYDYGCFKVPSFRNVAVSGPYMHDGRYKTLSQVINFYSDSLKLSPTVNGFIKRHIDTLSNGQYLETGGLHLTASEKQDFLNFLNGFTDTSFLHNPNLSNPF